MDGGASIISSRARRSNAGSRLAALLALQEPLDDEEEIWKEVADDKEFELPSEPEDDLPAEVDEDGDDQGQADGEDGAAGDDENFSDLSDDSVENDEEEDDAGEQRLIKQQREALRKKRRADRDKMLRIKPAKRARIAEPENPSFVASTPAAPAAPSRRRSAARVETLLSTERRVSQRASAVRNKERVIERLRADELRRAEYVVPVVREKKKLTQEERLEEAKRTELKNIASLQNFVRVEEFRKHQQRLALLGKRPKLTEFVRWRSSSQLEYPVIEVIKEQTAEELAEKEKREQAEQEAEHAAETEAEAEAEAAAKAEAEAEATAKAEAEAKVKEAKPGEASKAQNGSNIEAGADDDVGAGDGDGGGGGAKASEKADQVPAAAVPEQRDDDDDDESARSDTNATATEAPELDTETLAETGDDCEPESEPEREVAGPPRQFEASVVTFHDFPNPINNRYAVKRALLGPVALRAHAPPARRLCAITGKLARYVDPHTNIAFYSLDAHRIVKSLGKHSYAWSTALGGVYAHSRENARHARGVPDGFA